MKVQEVHFTVQMFSNCALLKAGRGDWSQHVVPPSSTSLRIQKWKITSTIKNISP